MGAYKDVIQRITKDPKTILGTTWAKHRYPEAPLAADPYKHVIQKIDSEKVLGKKTYSYKGVFCNPKFRIATKR